MKNRVSIELESIHFDIDWKIVIGSHWLFVVDIVGLVVGQQKDFSDKHFGHRSFEFGGNSKRVGIGSFVVAILSIGSHSRIRLVEIFDFIVIVQLIGRFTIHIVEKIGRVIIGIVGRLGLVFDCIGHHFIVDFLIDFLVGIEKHFDWLEQ